MQNAFSMPSSTSFYLVLMAEDQKSPKEPSSDDLEEGDGEEENEWFRSTPKPKPRLFAYNWAQGT